MLTIASLELLTLRVRKLGNLSLHSKPRRSFTMHVIWINILIWVISYHPMNRGCGGYNISKVEIYPLSPEWLRYPPMDGAVGGGGIMWLSCDTLTGVRHFWDTLHPSSLRGVGGEMRLEGSEGRGKGMEVCSVIEGREVRGKRSYREERLEGREVTGKRG